ncbi:MAG: inositol monophosphatase [Betaproteobacteria bacterium]|jgi:myo-inositol-1(or 4)-monophosphatase|nr:inositol monophosphatase [Betaproteobacteria bacterium]MDA9295734.1 inositol monophosphatase [Burkholderiales bacterium]MBT5671110.1 inositol monophosphatase [Betaproteobacteria bacterium]MBT6185208.1 inositol monophosphatase [Betaproteobacteria bacterium]MBT6531341.1 inositol monophosphatase [Betaproteobacteria bacterium]|tara:strand:+ start:134 stop:925 length:792 start_codon:yes stop_codon:yes gene_type:complete
MNPMLGFAVKAARRAGDIINRAAENIEQLTVQHKTKNDLVSEVDRAAEAEIINSLKNVYPEHAFLAEESGRTGSSDFEWIIDPLDGTTNFLHGFPVYGVSIALAYKKQLQVAVVFDPCRNDLYTASRGAGAYLNEKRIRVSKRDKLIDCLIGTGFPFKANSDIETYAEMFKTVALNTAGIRRPGAAALDLANVAAGRLDGFWEIGLSPWDMAAGALLIKEAGGLVGDLEGEDQYLETGKIIAGNPKIFAQMLSALRPHSKKLT